MALYTSYYTRQLALRPTGTGNELQQEGEKTLQKTVARRTVDYSAPYITWFEVRQQAVCAHTPPDRHEGIWSPRTQALIVYKCAPLAAWFPMQRRLAIRCPADVPALPPVAAGALQLLPPAAYVHQPATSFNIKFAGQAPSKVGCSSCLCFKQLPTPLRCFASFPLAFAVTAKAPWGTENSCMPLSPCPQTRSSINAATWTPDGRRCLTGTQVRTGRPCGLSRSPPLSSCSSLLPPRAAYPTA
jgi:hypothetical protein